MRYEKIAFFEKIAAENCWGAKGAYFDVIENDSYDDGEGLDLQNAGYICADNSLSIYITGQIRAKLGECAFNAWQRQYVIDTGASLAGTSVPRIHISFTSGFTECKSY